jgi:hypothetical protein
MCRCHRRTAECFHIPEQCEVESCKIRQSVEHRGAHVEYGCSAKTTGKNVFMPINAAERALTYGFTKKARSYLTYTVRSVDARRLSIEYKGTHKVEILQEERRERES